jgi:hypothetical protein
VNSLFAGLNSRSAGFSGLFSGVLSGVADVATGWREACGLTCEVDAVGRFSDVTDSSKPNSVPVAAARLSVAVDRRDEAVSAGVVRLAEDSRLALGPGRPSIGGDDWIESGGDCDLPIESARSGFTRAASRPGSRAS